MLNHDAALFYFIRVKIRRKCLRHRRKLRAFCISVRGFVRPVICPSFANNALNRFGRAHFVIDAKRRAIVVSEIRLSQIALEMLLADVMECPLNAPLED
jgi:hypothetical protein